MMRVTNVLLVAFGTLFVLFGFVIVIAVIAQNDSDSLPPSWTARGVVQSAIDGRCPGSYPIKVIYPFWFYQGKSYYTPETNDYAKVKASYCYPTEAAAQTDGFHTSQPWVYSLINRQNAVAVMIVVSFFVMACGASRLRGRNASALSPVVAIWDRL